MEQLHPGAKWVFRIQGLFSIGIFILVFIGFLISGVGRFTKFGESGAVVGIIIGASILGIILFIVGVEIYARMAYARWMYEFTNSNLKIEKGIIWKSYKNIPYERVQNIDVHRGILARMFGFSTIEIQTAGYSGGYGRRGGMPKSEGHIPAVAPEKAEEIRELLMKKISRKGM